MKRIIAATALAAGMAFGLSVPANAQEVPCGTPAVSAVYKTVVTPATEAVTVLVSAAVPAVPAIPGKDAVPAVAEVWANWSPNHTDGPQDYTPVWPEDSRGTWHVHDKIPAGHAGPDGVYQRDKGGNGNSDWFYRQAGVPEVPAVPEVPGKPAVDAVYKTIPGTPASSKRVLVSAAVPAGEPCTVTKTTVKRSLVREHTIVVDSPQVAPRVVAEAPKELAMTGSDNVPLGIAGGSMLVLGGLAYALRRRLSRS